MPAEVSCHLTCWKLNACKSQALCFVISKLKKIPYFLKTEEGSALLCQRPWPCPWLCPWLPGWPSSNWCKVQGFATATSTFCKQQSWSSSQSRAGLALPFADQGLAPCAAQCFWHSVLAPCRRLRAELSSDAELGAGPARPCRGCGGRSSCGGRDRGGEAKWISLCSWQRSWDSSLSRLFCSSRGTRAPLLASGAGSLGLELRFSSGKLLWSL